MIKVLTDTSSSFTWEEYQQHQIIPLPIHIHFLDNHKSKKDLQEISAADFYKAQRAGRRFSTSHLTTEDFLEIFPPLLEDGSEIICILLSSGISECVNTALQAVEILKSDKISIVDSKQSGFCQAYMALKAKEMANKGSNRSEIAASLNDLRQRCHTFFIVESLQHLYAGGRFFWEQALSAARLNIKPIIWFDNNGKLKMYQKLGSVAVIRNKILNLVSECVKREIEWIVLHYADNFNEASEYAKELEAVAHLPVPLIRLAPSVGVHTGPDLLGPSVITKK
ncbi:MAG: DegV family protein [Firmicutes bacterium]|nr:DegV family protein [Bacillota bacterium]